MRDTDVQALRAAFDEYAEGVEDLRNQVTDLDRQQRDLNGQIAGMRIGFGEADETPARGMTVAVRNQIATEIRATMRKSSNPDGGYLVPTELDKSIGALLKNDVALRRLARIVTPAAGSYKRLVNIDGTASIWVGEEDARPETAGPQWVEIEFSPGEIMAQPKMTQQLIDDADIDIVAEVERCLTDAFSQSEGTAFISGNGQKKPRGILDYPTVANASYAWGSIGYIASGVAAALTDTNNNGVDALINLVYALRPKYRANATWLMNSLTASVVRKLKDGEGRYLWTEGSISSGEPSQLLGLPVAIDENMPAISADAFPIALADWSEAYTIFDRKGINILPDPYTDKPYVKLYSTKRVGGAITHYEAIKFLKIATN